MMKFFNRYEDKFEVICYSKLIENVVKRGLG